MHFLLPAWSVLYSRIELHWFYCGDLPPIRGLAHSLKPSHYWFSEPTTPTKTALKPFLCFWWPHLWWQVTVAFLRTGVVYFLVGWYPHPPIRYSRRWHAAHTGVHKGAFVCRTIVGLGAHFSCGGSGMKLNAAAIQMQTRVGDVSHNLGLAEKMVREAARSGARLIALPEFFTSAITPDERPYAAVLSAHNHAVSLLKRLASELDIWIGGFTPPGRSRRNIQPLCLRRT